MARVRTKAARRRQRPDASQIPARKGIVLRQVRGAERSFFEVEHPGELERLKGELTDREYRAGLMLRGLWERGTLNGDPGQSCVARLEDHGVRSEGMSPARMETHDRLKVAMRAMGMMGMVGRYALDVVAYDRSVETDTELAWLRAGLGKLADFTEGRRAA